MTSQLRDPSVMLTATEVARRLGVSPRTVKRMAPTELPFARIGVRGDRRYSRELVERFVADRTFGL